MVDTPARPAFAIPGLTALARRYGVVAALLGILLVGGYLRFDGLGWDTAAGEDLPQQMHPDERFISIVNAKIGWPSGPGEYFDTKESPLNPYNHPETPSFVYGTFPLFSVKAVAELARADVPLLSGATDRLLCGGVMGRPHPPGADDEYATTVVCGRHLTALVDTVTIVLVFLLAGALFGRPINLLAALLYALAVLPAQLAHFWAVDSWAVAFTVAAAWLSVEYVRSAFREPAATGRNTVVLGALVAGMGLSAGLGLASKVTAWPVLLAPAYAVGARVAMREWGRLGLRWQGERRKMGGHWTTDISVLCVVALIAIVTFRVMQPYAFAGPHFWDMAINPVWKADIQRESDFQLGNVDFPPFIQFAGRTPFAWPVENMVRWGLGPALAMAAAAGAIAWAILLFRRREVMLGLPLLLIVAVFVFQKTAFGVLPVPGARLTAYMRYFAPAYPFLCLAGAWALVRLVAWAERPTGWRPRSARLRRGWEWLGPGTIAGRRIAAGVFLAVTAVTAWWALAFHSVYGEEHTRLAASRWVYENLKPGERITGEFWDDTLPYPIRGEDAGAFVLVDLYPYDTDSVEKVRTLVYGRTGPDATLGLQGADYVALTSNRIRNTVPRLEREYPATIRYYELLESGELGFDLVARFATRPTFLDISVNDSGAEESFTVYDHPEVRIFKKSQRWDADRAFALLLEAHPERAVNLLPKQGRTNGLQFTAAEAQTQQQGGTFNDVFDARGLTSHLPWVWWLLWIEVAAFACVPWITWVFRALPDRGYGLSKLVGFVTVGLAAWMAVAWGLVHFSAWTAWGSLAVVAGSGYALGFVRRRALAQELRERWRWWLAVEVLFLGVFFAFLALRYANPDLWYNPQGGEKPVELAYLTAVTRSTILPPYDPWFAGGTMNYYYMGWFLLSVPMRALRIVPEGGFNLGIPTYAALGATVAFSTAGNLVGLARGRMDRGAARRFPWRLVAGGALGALLLIGIGNLAGAHQAIERFQALNLAEVSPTGEERYHWGLFSDVPFLGGLVGFISGLWRWTVSDAALRPYDWWAPSRAHPPAYDITEFPFWSLLFGDLHPHLMGLSVFGAVVAGVVAYVASVVSGAKREAWVIAALLGLGTGLVRTLHTWDFPTSVLLVASGMVAGQVLREGRWQQRWWDAVAHLAVAGAVMLVAFAPYTGQFEVYDTGFRRSLESTDAGQYFAHFGLFVTVMVAFIAVRYYEVLVALGGNAGRNPVLLLVRGRWEVASVVIFLVGMTLFLREVLTGPPIFGASGDVIIRNGLAVRALGVVALIFLANLLWLEWRSRERAIGRLLATAMFTAAVGISVGVDVVQAKNDVQRMNTVFKFSLQAWQLYALASAFAIVYVGEALARWDGWQVRVRPGRGLASGAAALAIGVLLAGSLVYPWSGTRARQDARFAGSPGGTLDGLRYLQYGVFGEDLGTPDAKDDVMLSLADDEPLIRWLRANVQGSPVIVEAVGPLYHWTGRMSWNTGLPAVVGWDWHQIAYRTAYADLVLQRRAETVRFYREGNEFFARSFLEKYNVSYVVVGTEELAFGTPDGLAKFAQMKELQEVFRSGRYAIYEVQRGERGRLALEGPALPGDGAENVPRVDVDRSTPEPDRPR